MEEKWFNENWIKKIYYGDLNFAKRMPETEEYFEIKKKIAKNSLKLARNTTIKSTFLEYTEKVFEKEAIDAEFQFELGFKVAVNLIFQALGKDYEINEDK